MTYFSSLQNDKEKLANRHISSVIKLGHPDANLHAATRAYKRMGWLTDDEDALTLVKLGEEGFKIKVAERILLKYKDQVVLNYCPKCNRLARTPAARQCRHCGHDWH
ncbi:hypothetical protein [Pedobacter panaciterrae]|uniref:hypothetical protein n=1 Tax=Pedobacter panaciterrae TaxID=363849 RepID=UPI001C2053C3|nr:hypothetical protein [Pedobacter panaciterrae]